MFNSISKSLKKLLGTKSEREFKTYGPRVDEINEQYELLTELSNDELRNKTLEFRKRIAEYLSDIDEDIARVRQEAQDTPDMELKEDLFAEEDKLIEERDKHLEEVLADILPEAFAVVKETARRFSSNPYLEVTATDHDRDLSVKSSYVTIEGDKARWANTWTAAGGEITWNMVHYDVQLIGGMVLHEGKIAEMATGEGKTLVATLPAYLNGLSGQGVHVVTVNNYLARRDAEWVGPIFEFLFLTIDCIDKYQPHSPDRQRAYKCDITYGTNNEFGFDYLRDNMVRSTEERVQAKHHFAMIDEVDSVLVDDARTPLIISGPVPEGEEEQEYNELKPKVEQLYAKQKKLATSLLTEAKNLIAQGSTGVQEGEGGLALLRAHRALPKNRALIKYLSEEGIKVILQKTENHYMQENSKHMHIVDKALYFNIEEKTRNVELLEIGSDYLARFEDDADFFVMPDIASQMNAIESAAYDDENQRHEDRENLVRDYSVKSRRLHAIQQLLKAYTLFERDAEYVVMDNQVKIVDEQTGRMMEGRRYSDGLHQALEAKENVKVGELTQTYATVTLQNFFRMYHKLSGMTGTAETEAGELWEIYKLDVSVIPTNRPIIRDDREDLVFKTAREKYNAVIDEIVELSQAGRPVLVGTTSVDISEKLSRMLQLRKIEHNVLNAKQHQREADIVSAAGHPGAVTIATNMAGRGTDIKLGQGVKDAGGLAIIGTERHDSRRVDRQLRGRAGRQGDPGSSQFYVSLEDNLMRLFHSERIAKAMDRLGHQEGEVIQHSMVTKSIERAQRKVEENNFGIRKRLLEYDDVMNIQREAIYKRRRNALSGERLSLDLNIMFTSLAESLVDDFKATSTYKAFEIESLRVLGITPPFDEAAFNEMPAQGLIDQYREHALAFYQEKGDRIHEVLMPFIKDVYENEGHRYKRIAIPFKSSTHQELTIAADLKEAVESEGKSIMRDIEKAVTLALIDDNWKEHLRNMDELKDSAQAASFEQKDPLVIYKMRAYDLFEELIYKINHDVSSFLFEGKLVIQGSQQELQEARVQKTDFSKAQVNRREDAARRQAAMDAGKAEREAIETVKRQGVKIGRNDPCPCGSGKKYKHCHGRRGYEHIPLSQPIN